MSPAGVDPSKNKMGSSWSIIPGFRCIPRLDPELSSLGVIAQKERRAPSSDRVAEYRLMTTGFLFALGPESP